MGKFLNLLWLLVLLVLPFGASTDENVEDEPEDRTEGDDESADAGEITFTPEQQSLIDKLITGRLTRAKKKWAQEKDEAAAAAARAAEEAALAEQGQYRELADKQKAELEALRAAQAQAAEVEKAFAARLQADREGLPAAVIALLDEMPPLKQAEWLTHHGAELRKGRGGVPPSPEQGDGKGLTREQEATHREALQARYRRGW